MASLSLSSKSVPSVPSQAFEGFLTLGWAIALVIVVAIATPRPDSRLLLIAIAGWAFLRAGVATTWRDPAVIGGLGTAGVLSVGF